MNAAAPGKTNRPSSRGPLDNPHPDVVTGLGIGSAGIAQSNDETQRYFFFSASFFSAFGGAAAAAVAPSFFSPGFASAPAAGAAAPGAAAAAAPSTPSAAALPFASTSGSFAPSGPTA